MDSYYRPEDLPRFEEVGQNASEAWKAFMAWYGPLMKAGHLSKREKALIALAVSHSEKCPYCIDAYTQTCLENGITLDEMTEAVHVAAAMRAGVTLAHGVQMRNVAQNLSF
ncbi:MAG: carboxymuconolactone decarboxylase family protein [Candidatus Delongbacteria bacterium]|nr:arsenosugar biosynthesis-associated peroxidase-like protein [Candidatus Cloacimonadota bacterium]MCA9787331.1 arsenosugar biosynthesis-associated peroxidase-like protein [Candidatus Cloacimonadota bacterium]MCB9472377.1 carboxymuconolactone decarboxylase family protein [Candidatus Delongbacteria bacterium]